MTEHLEKDKENEKVDLSDIKKSINQYKEPQGETDPDLIISYEIIDLPSKGLFYPNKISKLKVEYMTSRDEDLLTTPSLIESGEVIDILLKRKIKSTEIQVDKLLTGDRSAVILFLRTSSYGNEYTVSVNDPRTGIPFKTTIDLYKLKYKEMVEKPDTNGYFNVYIPMRKKEIKFRLLTSGEENYLFKQAEALKDTYSSEFSEFNTMRLKSSIVAIGDKTDRSYIDKFVDAMPAGDALTIRKKILDVSPDIDMKYEFTAKDGYKFWGKLELGADFFFPET
ncbi:MAG: hypothetical protein ACOCVF_00515 [bacterium]